MSNSHASFEDRIGKFKAGNVLVQSWGDYVPTNALITKAAYTAFIAAIETANDNVISDKTTVGDKQDDRKEFCFTLYDDNTGIGITNPDCAEQRIIRVHSYLLGALPEGSSATDAVHTVLKKIRPNYEGDTKEKSFTIEPEETITVSKVVSNEPATNTGNTTLEWREAGTENTWVSFGPDEETTIIAPSGKIEVNNLGDKNNGRIRLVVETGKTLIKSPSEKTFASIPGYLKDVIRLVSDIDPTVYTPPDPLLSVAELSVLYDQITAANGDVTAAMETYGDANRIRKDLYDHQDGMQDRIRLTKSYLGSFSGGKKSSHYIEYSQALKGT